MARLRNITFVFPGTNENEQQWNRTFNRLISGIPSVHNAIALSFSDAALPSTGFRTGLRSSPAIILDTEQSIQLKLGNILIKNAASGEKEQLLPDEEIESCGCF